MKPLSDLHENLSLFWKSCIGGNAPMIGIVVSMMDDVEAWLRIASLIVGICVGIVTIWSLLRHKKGRK